MDGTHLHQEAVLTRDAVALADLGHTLGQLDDPRELTGARPQPHPRRDGQPECGGVDVEPVAADDTGLLEFLPVIALAALAARTRRNVLALSLAVLGVYLLTDVRLVAEPVGIAFAAANAVLFAGYIVLGHRVSRNEQLPGIDGLALSMMIAAVVALPVGITDAAPATAEASTAAA